MAADTPQTGESAPMVDTYNVYRDAYQYVMPGGEEGFLNYGLWDRPLDEISPPRRLCEYMLAKARIEPGARVINVGPGLGEIDRLCATLYRPAEIVGVELNPTHVEIATAKARESGFGEVIRYVNGDACDMPESMGSDFDRLVGLECVDEFGSRARFFRSAARRLAPGGLMVLVDVYLNRLPETEAEKQAVGVVNDFWDVSERDYTQSEYVRDLEAAGFEPVEFDSIRKNVWGPLFEYLGARIDIQRPVLLERFLTEEQYGVMMTEFEAIRASTSMDLWDYNVVTARKKG